MFIVAGIGFIGSLIAFIFSFIPPGQISVGSPTTYVVILIALTIFFVGLPFIIYANRKPHWKDEDNDFAPFTWELENTHPGIPNDSDTHTSHLAGKQKDETKGA